MEPKRPRGRPRKHPLPEPSPAAEQAPRKRGRPRKHPLPGEGSGVAAFSAAPPTRRGPGRPRKHPVSEAGSESPPAKRPRGRPRKHPLPEVPQAAEPTQRKRGRPRKTPLPAAELKEVIEEVASPPAKRPRGRPRKHPLPEEASPPEPAAKPRGRPRKTSALPAQDATPREPVVEAVPLPEGHRLTPPRWVYAERGGMFWRFTPQAWLRAAENAARTGGLPLSKAEAVPIPEGMERFHQGGGRILYRSRDNGVRVYSTEHWDAESYAYHAGVFRTFYGRTLGIADL